MNKQLFLISSTVVSLLNPQLSAQDDTAAASDKNITSIFKDGLHRFDVESELLHSSDIDLDQYNFQYEIQQAKWRASLAYTQTRYDEEYQPEVIGNDAFLSEKMESIQAQFTWQFENDWELGLSTRYYDGFSNYRSVWIAEYYRQLFGLIPGYETPDPSGTSYTVVATKNYAQGHSITYTLGYGEDEIAPGYSVGALGVEPSRSNRYNKRASIRFDDTWLPWLKSEHLLSYSDTTDRDTQLGVSSNWHIALADDWTLRLQLGYTDERDSFDARYGNLAVEWRFSDRWQAFADVSVYNDSGEIPDAGLSTTAAPGLDTVQYGLGVRWLGDSSSFKIYIGEYETKYDPLSANNQIFSNLYSDRDFTVAQLSYTLNF